MAATVSEGGGSVYVPPKKKKKKPSDRQKWLAAQRKAAEARRRAEAERRRRAAAAAAAAKAAAMRAAAATKANAQRKQVNEAAALRAEQIQRVQLARRAAYDALKHRQQELLRTTGIIKPNPAGRPAAKPKVTPGTKVQQPKIPDAIDERRELFIEQQKRRAAEGAYRVRVRKAVDDPKASSKSVKAALDEIAKRSVGGYSGDNDTIEKLTDKFVKHAEKVAADYKKLVGQINKAIDKKNIARAKTLYYSPRFKHLAAQYVELFGNGKDPGHDGSVAAFFKTRQGISDLQTEWWKRQVAAATQAMDVDRKDIKAQMDDARRSGDVERWKQLRELDQIYSGNTGWVQDGVDKYGRTKYRQRTVAEELDYREALKRIEMGKIQAQQIAAVRQEQRQMQLDGLGFGQSGRQLTRSQLVIEHDVLDWASRNGQPVLKSSEDLSKFAGGLLKEWEIRNPKPRNVGSRQGGVGLTAKLKQWQAGRDAYEKNLYSYFGGSTPAVWDSLLQAPGFSHALALLQAPVSSIGAGGRVLTKALTGSSQIDVDLGLVDAPPEIQQKFAGLAYAGQLPGTFNMKQRAAFAAWKKSPEGQAWLAGKNKVQTEKAQREDAAFQEGFYNSSDPGERLRALNAYGQQPTNRDALNLGFQLLADPTNAIPLKFTTYLARAKYAAELGNGSTFLKSAKFGSIRDFVAVDEGTLRLRGELDKVLKNVGKGDKTARQITDELLGEVANITSKSERDAAIRKKLIAAGLSPREINDTQLLTLIEQSVKDRAAAKGIHYASQAEDLKAKIAAQEAAAKAAGAGRLSRQKAQEAANLAARKKRLADARRARVKLDRARAGKLPEVDYWLKVESDAKAVLANPHSTIAQKAAARADLADVKAARFARDAKGNLNYVPPAERKRFRNRVNALHGNDAEDLIAPRTVAPYVEDVRGVRVEQSRTYLRTLLSADPKAAPGVKTAGPGHTQDYLPLALWNTVETEISDALFTLRKRRNELLTGARQRKSTIVKTKHPVGRLRDTDPAVIAVKKKVLDKYGITIDAYDEVRKVLRPGHVQAKNATRLMKQARAAILAGGDYAAEFKRLRTEEARLEGRRQLGALAHEEMYGHPPDEVMEEFLARYGDDGLLRKYTPELSTFQRRTLEEHVKELSGVKSLSDKDAMREWLQSRNKPPFISREMTREFLLTIGAWSPRRAKQFTAGAKSWSVEEEAKFWFDNYGEIPDWANAYKLADPDQYNEIFHDQMMYGDQMQKWGIFNRAADMKLRLSGASAKEIEDKILHGDPVLGLNAKRELDLQRKYVVERYGSLVGSIDKHGNTSLTTMPWLMYPDELRAYFGGRLSRSIADDLIKNEGELDEVLGMIDEAMDDFWDKYISPAAAAGPIMYDDIWRLASEIQARLLANPKWAKRSRDVSGNVVNAHATVVRGLVFTNPAFAVANAVDSPIKSAWYRFANRGLFNANLHGVAQATIDRANKLVPQDLGIDLQTTIYRLKQRPVKEYALNPTQKGVAGLLERASAVPRGIYRIAPSVSAKVEVAAKMQLARSIWPTIYEESLKRLGDADLADAFTRKFVKDEIGRMWPTVGDGPIEKLFNQLVPFASYSVKNKLLFLSEAASHPAILNQIEFVGRYLEEQNRANWELKHPGEPMPDAYARRLELPWAPGYYLDLGQFSDATRGLKPLYSDRAKNAVDAVGQWLRIVNPGEQAGILMLTNALGVTQRIQWKPIYNEDGFITGYEKVLSGWTEPWSDKQPSLASIFWFAEVFEEAQKLGVGGLTNGEVAVLLGKLTLFDAIGTPDRGAGLFEYYKLLQGRNKDDAERWLSGTADGAILKAWLATKMTDPRDVADWLKLTTRIAADPSRWFHTQSVAFQDKVKGAYATIESIRKQYEKEWGAMVPGSKEYKESRAEMFFRISEVYRLHPELMIHEVYSKTPTEWGQQLVRWQENQKLDEFYALDSQRPKRADFKTEAAYDKATDAWKHQKEVFLKTYPSVEATIGAARNDFDRLRDEQEKEWDTVLDRIAKRGEAIKAALKHDQHDRADQLYLAQELDYSILENDRVALYLNDQDIRELPNGTTQKSDRLRQARVLLDFDRIRFDKATREGKAAKFREDAFYANGMAEVILKAKGNDRFGKFDAAKFVAELRKHPKLLALYFAKHKGKEEQWRRNDAYIAAIAPWGKAARAGDWDRAQRIWDSLPQWVRDKYTAGHPRKARAVGSSVYFGWIQRWAKTFDSPDKGASMKFFWSMPKEIRERYFAKHPDKRVKYEADLRFGNELAGYFAADKANQPAYLKAHPDLAKWLAARVSTKSAKFAAIMAGYRAIPKDEAWLKRIYREKYPDVFSQEAIGDARLKRTFDRLAAHPEFTESFEKWRDAIWATYELMLRNDPRSRPKPIESVHTSTRSVHGLSAERTSR